MKKSPIIASITAFLVLYHSGIVMAQAGKALPVKTVKTGQEKNIKEDKTAAKDGKKDIKKSEEEKKQGTGIFGKGIKLHITGSGALTYPGGDIAIGAGTSAESSVNAGFDAGIGASWLFFNDMVGPSLALRYGGKNLAVSYSGTGGGDYTYHTGFMDLALGARGYFHAIYLYYETGLSYGIKLGDWTREGPAGKEKESDWSGGTDLNNNLALYLGAGVSYPLTPLLSLEAGFIVELGLIPVIKGPSPLGFVDRDKLYTRYYGLRVGVTFSL